MREWLMRAHSEERRRQGRGGGEEPLPKVEKRLRCDEDGDGLAAGKGRFVPAGANPPKEGVVKRRAGGYHGGWDEKAGVRDLA